MKIFSVLVYHLADMPISNQTFHMSKQINKDIRYFFLGLLKFSTMFGCSFCTSEGHLGR